MKKTLITILVTVLVCCCVVGGTLAWLMDSTTTITNTFTVGNVAITLAEPIADSDANNAAEFKMIPGTIYAKDPTVTVDANSENCIVFVKVEETNNKLTSNASEKFVIWAMNAGWTLVSGETNVYYYNAVKSAGDSIQVLAAVSDKTTGGVTINSNATAADMEQAETNAPSLAFTAYAIQSDSVFTGNGAIDGTTAATAWGYIEAANP